MRNRMRLRPRLSYANVMATIAVFGVLGGGAYATHTHRMGTNDLRNLAVTTPKLADDAVAHRKVTPNGIRRSRIGSSQVRPRHVADEAITAGGLAGVEHRFDTVDLPDGTTRTAEVSCEPGEQLLSGGGMVGTLLHAQSTQDVAMTRSAPAPIEADTWEVTGENESGSDVQIEVVAVCLQS